MPVSINGTGSITGVDSISSPSITGVPVGSASSPSISFTGDTNTGLYSPGADQVALSTGGTGRLFIDSSGRVGLGTSVPSNLLTVSTNTDGTTALLKLHADADGVNNGLAGIKFSGNAGDHAAYIYGGHATDGNSFLSFYTDLWSGSHNPQERVRIDSSGRVGIGSNSPSYLLDAQGDAAVGIGAANSNNYALRIRAGTSGLARIIAADTSDAGYIDYDHSGNSWIFRTSGSEACRIDSSQRLLVGTSSASGNNLLQVNSDASINGLTVGRGAGSISTCTAIGASALAANTTGTANVAVGATALEANTTGIENTAVGQFAAGLITTGNYNTCVGRRAGNHAGGEITTGSRNVVVGAYSRPSSATATDQIVLGTEISGQANSNVTIGGSGGKIYNAYTVNATWTQTSDQRLKRNIQDDALGLSFINRLRPVTFQWKPSNEIDQSLPYYRETNVRDTQTVIHGLIAQEVKAALDEEGVTTFAGWDQGEDGIQAISREMFVSPLIKAVQELSAQVSALQTEVAALKGV